MASTPHDHRRVVLDKHAFDRLLRSQGWGSLVAFCEKVNVDYSTLSRMRARSTEPQARTMFAVAEALNVPVEALFVREETS